MRVCVEKTIFEKLLEISANQQTIHLDGRNTACVKPFDIDHLRSANKIQSQHSPACVCPVNFWNDNRAPGAEVVAEPIRVPPFPYVVHLFEDRGVKLTKHPFPIGILVCFGKEAVR